MNCPSSVVCLSDFKKVSIVVVNYNSEDLLLRCNGNSLTLAEEFIVVDNPSVDRSLQQV